MKLNRGFCKLNRSFQKLQFGFFYSPKRFSVFVMKINSLCLVRIRFYPKDTALLL